MATPTRKKMGRQSAGKRESGTAASEISYDDGSRGARRGSGEGNGVGATRRPRRGRIAR